MRAVVDVNIEIRAPTDSLHMTENVTIQISLDIRQGKESNKTKRKRESILELQGNPPGFRPSYLFTLSEMIKFV